MSKLATHGVPGEEKKGYEGEVEKGPLLYDKESLLRKVVDFLSREEKGAK
jgi:hypothetical protein